MILITKHNFEECGVKNVFDFSIKSHSRLRFNDVMGFFFRRASKHLLESFHRRRHHFKKTTERQLEGLIREMNLLIPFDHLLNLFFSSTAVPPDGSHNYINRCELLSLHIFASNYCPHSVFFFFGSLSSFSPFISFRRRSSANATILNSSCDEMTVAKSQRN